MNLKFIHKYILFLLPLPLVAQTTNHLSVFLEKPKDFYSIDNEQFKIKWEPTTDKKLLHDQIHPSEQKSFSLLYHWDFSKQDSQKAVTCQFFPTFDLSSLTSEENIFENVKPKIPQGLFPIFQINF